MREEKSLLVMFIVYCMTNGMQIFLILLQSEQTHTEAVRTILIKYNIIDPVTDDDTVGVFVNSDLQKLYTDLTTQEINPLKTHLKSDLDRRS